MQGDSAILPVGYLSKFEFQNETVASEGLYKYDLSTWFEKLHNTARKDLRFGEKRFAEVPLDVV